MFHEVGFNTEDETLTFHSSKIYYWLRNYNELVVYTRNTIFTVQVLKIPKLTMSLLEILRTQFVNDFSWFKMFMIPLLLPF